MTRKIDTYTWHDQYPVPGLPEIENEREQAYDQYNKKKTEIERAKYRELEAVRQTYSGHCPDFDPWTYVSCGGIVCGFLGLSSCIATDMILRVETFMPFVGLILVGMLIGLIVHRSLLTEYTRRQDERSEKEARVKAKYEQLLVYNGEILEAKLQEIDAKREEHLEKERLARQRQFASMIAEELETKRNRS